MDDRRSAIDEDSNHTSYASDEV